MNNIIQTIRHTARAATVLLIALLAAQTAGAQMTVDVSKADGLASAFGNTDVSEINVTDNITGVGGLSLNHDLTINLNGHTISSDELHFNVGNGYELTINGGGGSVGNIISGNAVQPAIQNDGTVTLSHVNITTNSDCAIGGTGMLYIGNNVSFNGWTTEPFDTPNVNTEDGNYNYAPGNPLANVVATVTVGGKTHYFENSGAALAYIVSHPDNDHFSLSGTTYTIHTATGWDAFCYLLANNAKGFFDGKTVRLGADIGTADDPVTSMAGASGKDFTGTFDGQGNTLTVDYDATENYAAPFRNAENGCVVENLHVAGTIATSAQYAAGIIGNQFGTVTIRNCRVSVTISSSMSGDGTHGGLVAVKGNNNSAHLTIEGCVFDGKIVSTGTGDDATTNCGGFVGWRKDDGSLTITNCLYAPTADDNAVTVGATFARNGGSITNSYYTRTLGDAQGKALHSVTAGDDVTLALSGTATEYTVSGITAYEGNQGIKYGTTYYAGSGDVVRLTLSNTATGAPAGYSYGYTASAGTLSGSTLTMPAADVTVSVNTAVLTVLPWSGDGTEGSPYIIYNKDQLDLLAHRVNGTHGEPLQTNGYYNTYFKLNNDITYDYTGLGDSDSNYEAIGGYYGGTNSSFRGHFDGNNNTISGIRIYRGGRSYADSYQGIFGVTYGADIHDLTLADARITGYDETGGIVGDNDGTVTRCHVADDVAVCAVQSSAYGHGGIVGYNDGGTIEQCTSAATLTTDDASKSMYYGGIAGYNENGTLSDNLAIGAIVPAAKDNSYGAITGYNGYGTLQRNYYAACKVANTPNATGVGCGYIGNDDDGYITADVNNVTNPDGARAVFALTLADGITTSTAAIVTHAGTGYYAPGTAIALSYSGTPGEGYQLGIVRIDGNGFTAAVADGDGHYTAVMPAANATATDHAPIDWATVSTGADKDNAYMIYNKDQLDLLAYRVNGTHGETCQTDGYSGKYFKLGKDIKYTHKADGEEGAATESNYEAIGDYHNGGTTRSFRGHFDGNNKTISGIRIYKDGDGDADNYQGIFGRTNGADIHDLTLADARITGYDYTGGIVGYNDRGTVTRCHVAADVAVCAVQSFAYNHGGIAGYNRGTIEQCTSAATLTTADAANSMYYGGIAGINQGTLSDNLAIGATVPAANDNSYGAITGRNIGSLQRNYYAACKVNDTPNATGVGCGYIGNAADGYTTADVNNDNNPNGAVCINTLALTANQAPDGNYWTTYYNSTLGFTIEGNACAYTATYGGDKLTLQKLGKEIPKNTAVIIVADNDEVSMATATDLDDFTGDNNLRGVDYDTDVDDITSALGDGTFYVLGMTTVDNEQHFGFHRYTGSTMAAHKAFVLVGGSPAARSLTMVFDEASGIESLTPDAAPKPQAAEHWFTLDGRRLQAKPTAPGIYINNGKKVVIK